jgi:DNA-binding NarL/FixJ family response regulator
LEGDLRALSLLNIVIVDDSAIVREQLRRAFVKVGGFTITGTSTEVPHVLNLVRAKNPDIVVLDISMPHRQGIQTLREIRAESPSAMIVMFTADSSVVLKEACLEAGANFYLDKSQLRELVDICAELSVCQKT